MVIDIKTLTDDFSGHAGGDKLLMKDVIELILTGKSDNESLTTLEHSLESHYVAFAAEASRLNSGETIDVEQYIKDYMNKGL